MFVLWLAASDLSTAVTTLHQLSDQPGDPPYTVVYQLLNEIDVLVG